MRKERKGKNCSLFSLSALVWLFDKAMSAKYREGPDGGWGWLVVLASFLTHLAVDGIIYSDGLFLIVFESDFNAGKVIVSMSASVLFGASLLIGKLLS